MGREHAGRGGHNNDNAYEDAPFANFVGGGDNHVEVQSSEASGSYPASEDSSDEGEHTGDQTLESLTFGEAGRLRAKLGRKKFEATFGSFKGVEGDDQVSEKSGTRSHFRAPGGGRGISNKSKKDAPVELSSKQRVTGARQILKAKKQFSRDPRFSDLSGTFNEDLFKKSYSFIDDMKKTELTQVEQEMQKEKRVSKKAALKQLRDDLKRDMLQKQRHEEKRALFQEIKRDERAKVAAGKKPFYLKASEKKKIGMIQKYNTLKSQGQGQLNRFLEKREKRMTAKERRRIPERRGGAEQ